MGSRQLSSSRPRVAVVGAGPAGLTSAIAAARAGGDVMVLDERERPGGQLKYEWQGNPESDSLESLLKICQQTSIEFAPRAAVWGIFPGLELAYAVTGKSFTVIASVVILATGSTDLALPFAGSTLPGVMTATGVLRLVEEYRVLPGRRFVVIGEGPEATAARSSIERANGQLVLTVTTEDGRSLIVEGDGGVEKVSHRGDSYPADIVVVAVGRQPDVQLATLSECRLVWSPLAGGWVPGRNDRCETSQRGIFVAGDASGPTSIDVALAEGTYCGLCAAASVGLVDENQVNRAKATLHAADRSRFESMPVAAEYVQPWRLLVESAN
jgi:thioredoxin reductase